MTRILLLLIFIITFFDSFGQLSECTCEKRNIILENQYKCDTTNFSNGSRLYWQWNCDSAWLTFENKKRLILKSCEEMDVYSCQRTGLNFLKEYPQYLLFQYKWISGCCTPPDLVFISKENGKEIKRISKDQFVWGDVDENYVLYFSDTTFKSLIFLNHNTDKQYIYQFEVGKVLNTATQNQVLQLGDIFSNFKKNEAYFTFDFKISEGKTENLKIEIK